MAVSLVYNFNENDTATIRDYSSNGNDGTGSGISIAASTDSIGNDATFGGTDSVNMGNITYLNGVSAFSIHFRMFIPAFGSSGTLKVLSKSGVIDITYNITTSTLNCTVTDATATTFTVTDGALITGTYDISLVMGSNTLTLYKDNVSVDSDNTLTTVTASNSNNMTLGAGGGSNSADFGLNEFMIFTSAISEANRTALINEPNGILIGGSNAHDFILGDLIGDSFPDYAAGTFATVSYVQDVDYFRAYPILNVITSGNKLTKAGHLWDTTEDNLIYIKEDGIYFYDNINAPADVLSSAKLTHSVTKDGIIKNSSTKTANYTALSSDQRIYVDSSGGAFTITLESSPTTDRELEIIDKTGSCTSFNVTVAGNGNNIIGSANYVMSTDYEGLRLIFNGTNWNLN
jgi:hypothetical protein